MSFHHQVTFKCDTCDQNFTIDEDSMELPPGWLGLQIVVADIEGCIPEHEQENYSHFCCQGCLMKYTSSPEIRRRLCMADSNSLDEDEDDELDDEELTT